MTPKVALQRYMLEKCEEIAQQAGPVSGNLPPQRALYVAMGLGVQFALELADYDPAVAKAVLRSIHLDAPEAMDEWYGNARKFAALCTT